jgi:potassium uptake TrkH family protein
MTLPVSDAPRRGLGPVLSHPTRAVPLAFLAAMAIGTVLLMLPAARAGPDPAPFVTALFTATSAVCITGLIVVDTPTYWSPLGQAIILLLVQIGGLGIMTGSTLLGLLVSRRLRLTTRLLAQAETRSVDLADVGGVLRIVLGVTFGVELITALALAGWLHLGRGVPLPESAWSGLFHSVAAFNNAGFSIHSDNVMGFARDGVFLTPIMLASFIGGIGFPVLHELRREFATPALWSVHTKITLLGSALLLVAGTAAVLAYEWSNPATLGSMDLSGKLLGSLFHSVNTRSAGFNATDVGEMRTETLMVSSLLMLVGGGSASTAGGIKLTTFLILGLVVWAEIRGEPEVTAFRRRISAEVQRDALTVALLALATVSVASLALLSMTAFSLEDILFETVSAFATVGLSTGITDDLPAAGQLLLVVLMFAGRVGTITIATALALRHRPRPFRYPEERPIVG